MFGGIAVHYGEDLGLAKKQEISSGLQASLVSIFKENLEIKEEAPARILFTGDIMLSRLVENRIYVSGDFKYPFLKIGEFLSGADLTVGNLEGPISSKGENQGSKYSFRADPKVVEGLKYAGFDVLSLANNHILDWGREALADTVYLLNFNGISTTGAGENEEEANRIVIKEVKGNKIAFLSFTDLYPESFEAKGKKGGISNFDIEKIKSEIKDLKETKKADIAVVSLHFGEEYETKVSKAKREMARALIDSGADLFIGHHPHVAQEVEIYNGKFIAHSLGNFVFDQDFSEETMRGLILEVEVKGEKIISVKEVPIKINEEFQPEIVI